MQPFQWRIQDFPLGGGANSQGSYVSKNLYVKIKESGPLWGGARAGGAPWIRQCILSLNYVMGGLIGYEHDRITSSYAYL